MTCVFIPRTHGVLIVDIDWYLKIRREKISISLYKTETNCYAKHKTKYLHRMIAGAQKGQEVDHINGNALDNRRSNLRLCTRAENEMNKPKRRGAVHSKYKGVCRDKRTPNGGYFAYIDLNKKRKYLGTFKTEREAAMAYNEAAKMDPHGFRRLNEIE